MNFKNKNLIPYLFALIVLVGIFGLAHVKQAHAQTASECIFASTGPDCDNYKNSNSSWKNSGMSGGQCTVYGWDLPACNGKHGNYKPATTTASGTGAGGSPNDPGTCTDTNGNTTTTTRGACKGTFTGSNVQNNSTNNITAPSPTDAKSALQNVVDDRSCISLSLNGGCVVKFFYYVIYGPSAFLLWVGAYFFNVLISITLNSSLFAGSSFIPTAWAVVRDLSNIFFILILLFVSVQLILGLGSDAQKTIPRIIIIALLINFSMFFTEVVIDSSNILALIFYNKMSVDTKNTDGTYRPYASANGEKDVAGGMVNSFNPTHLLSDDFFKQAAIQQIPGGTASQKTTDNVQSTDVPTSTIVGIILVAATIMLFAAYAFFVSGLSFVGRMIELFILIIFSPFAFMSYSIPLLSDKVEYIGWKDWFSRLLTVSFMAPIFMFFMYFIFLLVQSNLFDNFTNKGNTSMIGMILQIVIPAMLLLILLIKAMNFAKKGSGELGKLVTTGAKMVGGLAIGAATGGMAVAGRMSLGRAGALVANSKWAKTSGAPGRWMQNLGEFAGKSSFDVRGAKIAGQSLAGVTGMKLGEAQKGGIIDRRKEQVAKRQERAKRLEVGEDEKLKQDVRKAEVALQAAKSDAGTQNLLLKLNEGKKEEKEGEKTAAEEALKNNTDPDKDGALKAAVAEFKGLGALERDAAEAEKKLADAERSLRDAINQHGATSFQADHARGAQMLAVEDRDQAKSFVDSRKKEIREAGHTIHDAEVSLKMAENNVVGESNKRKNNYADAQKGAWHQAISFVASGGQHSFFGAREAANKIRSDAAIVKSNKGGTDHGGGGGGHASAPAHTPTPPASKPASTPPPAAHGPTGGGGGGAAHP